MSTHYQLLQKRLKKIEADKKANLKSEILHLKIMAKLFIGLGKWTNKEADKLSKRK